MLRYQCYLSFCNWQLTTYEDCIHCSVQAEAKYYRKLIEALLSHENKTYQGNKYFTVYLDAGVLSILVIDSIRQIVEAQSAAMDWLDKYRYMLEESTEIYKHTVAATGFVEYQEKVCYNQEP